MKYEVNEGKGTVLDEKNSVEKIKSAIMALLELEQYEQEVVSSIKSEKDLAKFLSDPSKYLSKENANAFEELEELVDMIGGVYFA